MITGIIPIGNSVHNFLWYHFVRWKKWWSQWKIFEWFNFRRNGHWASIILEILVQSNYFQAQIWIAVATHTHTYESLDQCISKNSNLSFICMNLNTIINIFLNTYTQYTHIHIKRNKKEKFAQRKENKTAAENNNIFLQMIALNKLLNFTK